MKKFIVKWNHIVFKPDTYEKLIEQEKWELTIEAESIEDCKAILKKEHRKNPFYFTVKEIK